jgi:hypothetical protein
MQLMTHRLSLAFVLLAIALAGRAAEVVWTTIPPTQWQGTLAIEVAALKRNAAVVVAYPPRDASPLAVSAAPQAAGLYEVRVTLRPSHTAGAIAYNSGLRMKVGTATVADFPGQFFARAHQPETRTAQIVHPDNGPLRLRLEAYTDAAIVKTAQIDAKMGNGGPDIDAGDPLGNGDEEDGEAGLTADKAVYYVVDKVEFRPLSHSGGVVKVECDKIRYLPGSMLKGSAVVQDLGGHGGQGMLNLYLEHGVRDRVKVKSLPVTLAAQPQTVAFELTLPQGELGYAVVAEYASADGTDRAEAAEYFNIAENFQRVAIFGGGLSTRDVVLDDATIRRGLTQARTGYFNATEYFAWAEDDMVAMSPDTDFWSSGQTNYRMNKQTLQRQIRLAHEQGFAVATYGKFVMSGLTGWETAYDYPYDHRGQYNYPVGMWEGVNVHELDRRRDKDFTIYSKSPNVGDGGFRNWWSTFMPINPDASPRMARIAAEEVLRSIDMFGWDAIRWDGHPRGAGWVQCGASGNYQAWAARQTQSLVRYFKDIVAAKHPEFRHGYNYLLIEQNKGHDWAVEDYELDELCRGGGLLMNESIGNASAGWTFAQIARNLQVEGDLCRERGGYYLGISFAMSPRDIIIESALWAAAGCRPYNAAMSREIRRYCTRYSQYTFDERLRRLATPEKVLAPRGDTKLWWQPFVYETPLADGKRQLVVNLLNLPLQVKRPNNRDSGNKPKLEWEMPAGTDPVTFTLTLPAGLRATGVSLIDPQTLAVTPLALNGNAFEVPGVAAWQVAVIDLAVDAGAPSLAALYGVQKTFGVPRPGVKETERKAEVVLDPKVEIWEVNKRIGTLAPEWELKRIREQAALDALSGAARDQALLARRQTPEALAKEWWKGAAIPADLALQDKRPAFGDLTPQRNGRFDIFYARGAMEDRLKLPQAYARLERFQVHDAWLWGAVRQGPGMGLAGNVRGARYADYDVLVFSAIPHAAIGVENSYALVDYVKAGGGAFFTGGEYAFGKGGYMHTVLERELLPLQCTGMVDTVYVDPPQPLEAGPDFAALNAKCDLTAKPAYWVRNEVVLKPGAKVFLKSGDRPILVGWQLEKGRVACLLVDHRGKSGPGVTAFFDWPEWPRVEEAVLRWLAPDAGRVAPAKPTGDAKALAKRLDDDATNDEAEPGEDDAAAVVKLDPKRLKARVSLIEQALSAGGPEVAAALARQLASVSNLPQSVRLPITAQVAAARPANLAALGKEALRGEAGALQGCGFLFLAMAGDPEFAKVAVEPLATLMEAEDSTVQRQRDLALAVALYPKPDLVEEGKRRVAAWNAREAAVRADYAQQLAGDTAMLETSTYLEADVILARAGWLAYLARFDAKTYGAAFVHEWLLCAQYQDYCGRSIGNATDNGKKKADGAVQSFTDLSTYFATLQGMTRADVEALIGTAPAEVAAALARVRFSSEVRTAANLLGNLDKAKAAAVLVPGKVAQPDLAAFAAARAAK